MKYVKQILSDRTVMPVRSKYSIGGDGISGRVVVHDTLLGTDETCDIQSLANSAVLGVSVNPYDLCGAVVKHTEKTIKLHKYVVSTEVQYGTPDVSPTDVTEDTLLLRSGDFHGFVCADNTSVAINLGDDAVKLEGTLGSVALWTKKARDNNPKVFTLYDLLAELCQVSGQNLLKYRQLRLFSMSRNLMSVIRLENSRQADVFFAKMALDVCKPATKTRNPVVI